MAAKAKSNKYKGSSAEYMGENIGNRTKVELGHRVEIIPDNQ